MRIIDEKIKIRYFKFEVEQGITFRLCLVHLHISASNFSILAYQFSLHMLISKVKLTNLNLTSNFVRVYTQKLENWRVQTCGCTRQALKVIPWGGDSNGSLVVTNSLTHEWQVAGPHLQLWRPMSKHFCGGPIRYYIYTSLARTIQYML